MKKTLQLALIGAIALTGAVGFSSCSSGEEQIADNPNYDPVKNEVLAQFVFNVSTGNQPFTRQSAAATQATENQLFRGINHAVLCSFKQGSDGKHLAAAAKADKRFDLGFVTGAGTIDKDNSHRVIETSLPLNTNTLLFYGKAPEGSAGEADALAGLTAYDIYGHLQDFTICNGNGDEDLDLSATNIELASRIENNKGDFKKIQQLLAGILTCIMNSNLSGSNHVSLSAEDYTIAVDASEYPSTLTWSDYYNADNTSPVETGHVLYPLEKKLADAYREMTTIYQAEGELRAGYGEAILQTIEDLWSVINEVQCATPFSKGESVAKYLAIRIHERIKEYFNGSVPADGTNVKVRGFETTSNMINHFKADTAWPETADARPTDFESIQNAKLADFPQKMYHVAPGAAHYLFDSTKKQFFYVENYNSSAAGGQKFTVESYYYPAELLYFGNSPIRVSNNEHKPNSYPDGVANWDNDTQWSADWVKDSHVVSTTQSVAMKNDINYGTSLLKATVSYGAPTLKDNNHAIQKRKDDTIADTDEPDKQITVKDNSFKLVGLVISGQPKQVGWDFLPKSGSEYGYVYDYAITGGGVIPKDGNSVPNYTLVFDNYNATSAADGKDQDKVYVALELLNNSGEDFFGEHNVIRDGGTFYLIGELNLEGKTAPTWPTFHPLPPYKADGSSIKTPRVFMQDYMTSANFVIGENSLKHAYMTVPDLRYSSLTLGLSVDIQWSTGIDFGDVILGGGE